jgi:hypothetical protein
LALVNGTYPASSNFPAVGGYHIVATSMEKLLIAAHTAPA